jgi:hypothetical protein
MDGWMGETDGIGNGQRGARDDDARRHKRARVHAKTVKFSYEI